MQPYQRTIQQQEMRALTAEGYAFEITQDGYTVLFHNAFVGGATVALPRPKPLHWRHVQPTIDDNRTAALVIARHHKARERNN